MALSLDDLKFDSQGLIPAIAQDRLTGEVRMMAWMDRSAVEQTLVTRRATFYSRSRQRAWVKGEESGNVLEVVELLADCDGDTLLVLCDPQGPSCHTGRDNCFFQPLRAVEGSAAGEGAAQEGSAREGAAVEGAAQEAAAAPAVAGQTGAGQSDGAAESSDAVSRKPFCEELEGILEARKTSTGEKSYTRSLFDGGAPKIGVKIREEAGELVQALEGESDERVASEAADLFYHALVGLRFRGIAWRSVLAVLAGRLGVSGHAEKAARKR